MVDPRCFAASAGDRYVRLAESWLADCPAARRERPAAELVLEYRNALDRNGDAEIAASLRRASSAAVYRCMWRCLDAAVSGEGTGAQSGSVGVRPFAIPILMITGGRAGVRVSGVVPEAGRLETVLRAHGALGRARNFGLADALCSLEALRSLQPSELHALTRSGSAGALDLPPADIETSSTDEQVHLRFLLGAGLIPAGAPSFLETASAVAMWGMPFSRELADQLRTEGLSLLPIARPPAGLLAAQEIGSRAREELAFQAFVSRALRRLRAEAGEPHATVAALDSGAIGLRFASPFSPGQRELHSWTLHPCDDFQEVAAAIFDLLRDCRVEAVEVLPEVVPAREFATMPPL